MISLKHLISFAFLIFSATLVEAQMITGTWKGKINKQKVEVKIIQNGDSLTGTSYYYSSRNNYRRYSIKGYFDPQTNEAVWWDDLLIDQTGGSAPGKTPLLSRADFNCPGGGVMMLDGKAVKKENEQPGGEVDLDKTGSGTFSDEWDYVIDNFLRGGNDPWVIDSVGSIAQQRHIPDQQREAPLQTTITAEPQQETIVRQPAATQQPMVQAPTTLPPAIVPNIQQKFSMRKKVLVQEIPLTGDSVELRFYDNAEIDGDSISLFLNDKLVFTNVRLTGNAYKVFLEVAALDSISELTMVAENLGSIPPNTSYMVAIVGGKRYEARLESTEGSSAMIRFIKPGAGLSSIPGKD